MRLRVLAASIGLVLGGLVGTACGSDADTVNDNVPTSKWVTITDDFTGKSFRCYDFYGGGEQPLCYEYTP
jgi:hypothetical protein